MKYLEKLIRKISAVLKDYAIVQSFTSDSVSINAGSQAQIDIPITAPDGYEAIGPIGLFSSTGFVVAAFYKMQTSNSIRTYMRNTGSSTLTGTVTVRVLFVHKL